MSYEAVAAEIRKYLEDVPSELSEIDMGDSDHDEEAHISESEHDTDSEVSCQSDGDNENEDLHPGQLFIGRDKTTRWKRYMTAPRNIRTRTENIVLRLPGPVARAREAKEPLETFCLFMDDLIIRIITTNTNHYIGSVASNFSRERDARPTNEREIKAFLGNYFNFTIITFNFNFKYLP